MSFRTGQGSSGIGPGNIDRVYDIIFSRIDPGIEALIDASKMVHGWPTGSSTPELQLKFLHLIRDPRARPALASGDYVQQATQSPWRLIRTYPT